MAWPLALSPQANTVPSPFRATVCPTPAASALKPIQRDSVNRPEVVAAGFIASLKVALTTVSATATALAALAGIVVVTVGRVARVMLVTADTDAEMLPDLSTTRAKRVLELAAPSGTPLKV